MPRLSLHLSNHGSAAINVELARRAEAGGFETVWLSEDLYFRGAVPAAGAIAATTTKLKIGFGVLTPYSQHVSLLAMQLATLMDLAGPRIIAGLGAGVEARTRAMGVEYASPLVAVRETVEMLRQLMAGRSLTCEGRIHRAADLRLSFDDLPGVPPVYVAAVGPRALEQAGRIADGVVLSLMCTRAHVRAAVERIQAGASAAGRTAEVPTLAYVPFAVGHDRDAAIASLKPLIAYYVQRWAPIASLRRLFVEWGPLTDDGLTSLADALGRGAAPGSAISDEIVLEYCVAGSPRDCTTQLRALRAAGVTEVAAEAAGDTDDRSELVNALVTLQGGLIGA